MKTNIAILLIVGTLTYFLTLHLNGQSSRAINEVPNKESISKDVSNTSQIPAFSFVDINGKEHNIKDYKGKVIILNFWASWCAPCIKEFPNLLNAAKIYEDDVVLVALSSDLEESAIHKFIKKMEAKQDLSFEASNIMIALDTNQDITAKKFQTFKLPETIIIDQNLKMRHKLIGADWELADLKAMIEDLK